MEPGRSRNLTVRQIIGLVLIYFGLMQFFSIFVTIVYTYLQYMAGNILFPMENNLQRVGIIIAFALIISAGIFVLCIGLFLLRDKKGKYIKYLRN